jgi:hypoxanthine phosphoribosyltransferase
VSYLAGAVLGGSPTGLSGARAAGLTYAQPLPADEGGRIVTKMVEEAVLAYSTAELLYCADEVERALDRMAVQLQDCLAQTAPVLLCVMTGGLVPTGKLLTRLDFPLRLDYVHVTRYGDRTRGGGLRWVHRPTQSLQGRVVVVVDDILDEGITLATIVEDCRGEGARAVYSAVLVDKTRSLEKPIKPDFCGLQVPDRYVFGYGMDYKGYLRNAAGIYAVDDRYA